MRDFKSHFEFDNQQRSGILLLCTLLVGLLLVLKFYKPKPIKVFDVSSLEILTRQAVLDSLRRIEIEKKKPKMYPFNPNFITDYKAYTLGMSPKVYDRLSNFRRKNKWINSATDFKRVTQVSDSLLATIKPFFKFPEWVAKSTQKTIETKQTFSNKKEVALAYEEKADLNLATELELQKIYGIGPALSKRIVAYRSKLGGFAADKQLLSVWGLKDAVVQRVLRRFTVKTPKQVNKIAINEASASDIATIPGVSFDFAKEIWEFRVLHDTISSLTSLQKIEGMTASRYAQIELYLYID